MSLVLRNINQLWSYIIVETLKRLGISCAVVCPGSRSTPLTMAFAAQALDIEVIPILDERSAAFFALGRAKVTARVSVLVCTSGTAGANFYPAVIESRESCVPLLVITTDRPPELRNCHSGQTIDQVKLYANYPNWQTELATPSPNTEMLAYLRQTVIYAWERCQIPTQGPVHLNIPFRDPLAPIPDGLDLISPPEEFFSWLFLPQPAISRLPIPEIWLKFQRCIIIAGVAQPQQPEQYCRAIAQLSQILHAPVLAEGLSPLRNYADLNPYLISTYDSILRNPQLAQALSPAIMIQIGEMPTSKELRQWLFNTDPHRWIVDSGDRNLDPLHGKTTHLRISIEQLDLSTDLTSSSPTLPHPYLQLWCDTEAKVRLAIDETLENIEELFEGKVAWLISQVLPPETSLFIANSMPVRDVEFFWKPNNFHVRSYFNRGANGIDGTLSTALGIAHRQSSSVMLTGDLALLHDTNGFLIRNRFIGHLTIILINNNGGGIFEMLPIANFDPPFEEFFATPQDIDFAKLCHTYGIEHELIITWNQLQARLNPLPSQGIRVLELRTNRKADAKWRQENLGKFSSMFR